MTLSFQCLPQDTARSRCSSLWQQSNFAVSYNVTMNKRKINDALTDLLSNTCSQLVVMVIQQKYELVMQHKKNPNTKFLYSVLSRIWTECDEL